MLAIRAFWVVVIGGIAASGGGLAAGLFFGWLAFVILF